MECESAAYGAGTAPDRTTIWNGRCLVPPMRIIYNNTWSIPCSLADREILSCNRTQAMWTRLNDCVRFADETLRYARKRDSIGAREELSHPQLCDCRSSPHAGGFSGGRH